MRVIVEVCSGPSRGHKIALRTGQVIRFGRTEWADKVFPHDDQMSSVHFSVEVTEGQCLLRDLKSVNGTQLNHVFVTEAVIRDGDAVIAGDTEFKMCIEGGPARPATAERRPDCVRDPARIALDASLAKPSYRVETCSSGLTLVTGAAFGGVGEPPTISGVAGPLVELLSCYLIVDFKKVGWPAPEQSEGVVALFDWLPPAVAAAHSPLIIAPGATIDRNELLDGVWDQDAAVVIFSQQAEEVLVRHLRAAVHLNLNGSMPVAGAVKGMLGYCWPSVLAPLLAFCKPGFVKSLLSGIDAVLIEIPDLPGTWQIYGHSSFADVLKAMSFREVTEDDLAKDPAAAPCADRDHA